MKEQRKSSLPMWVGGPHPQKWAFKKDMPPELRSEAYKVSFGIYGCGWIACDYNNHALMPNGGRMQIIDCYQTRAGMPPNLFGGVVT